MIILDYIKILISRYLSFNTLFKRGLYEEISHPETIDKDAEETRSVDICLSGVKCLNPDPNFRPTKLTQEGSASRNSGYCSYCRKAGVHVSGNSEGGANVMAVELFDLVPSGKKVPTEDSDLSDYEDFDPDNESVVIGGQTRDTMEPKVAEDKNQQWSPSQVKNDAKSTVLAEKNVQDPEDGKPTQKKRGRPPKNKPFVPSIPKNLTVIESKSEDGIPDFLKRIRDPNSGDFKDAKDEPSTGIDVNKSRQVDGEAEEKEKNRDAFSDQALSEEGSPVVKNSQAVSSLISKVSEKMRGVSHVVYAPRVNEDDAQVGGGQTGGSVQSDNRLGTLRRLKVAVMETFGGVVDVAGASGRVFVGASMVSIKAVACMFILPLTLVGATRKFPRVFLGWMGSIFRSAKMALSPFLDGRWVPAGGLSMVMGAGVLEGALGSAGYGASVAMTAGGAAMIVLWPLYRGFMGAINGHPMMANKAGSSIFTRLSKKWGAASKLPQDLRESFRNPKWTVTQGLGSVEVARLNDEFEVVTARALEEMGFRVRVNGTQAARANGHSGSGDGGVDVFATDVAGHTVVVSCKRYASNVSVDDVRKIYGVAESSDFKGAKPMLVTTVGFTGPALEFAGKNGVVVVTLDSLISEALKYKS
jgi:hypothetical protein